jgi:hypothetical protein
MTLEDTESAADALVGGMEKLPISERWASCRTVRPYQEPRTASADIECATRAFLEDWLKVLAWVSICQRSGRMTTPNPATVV